MTTLHKMVNGEAVPLTPEEIAEIQEREAKAADQYWQEIRRQRNARLSDCDWTQLSDAPVDKVVWSEYRQALRDITNQDDPFNVIWPEEPNQ